MKIISLKLAFALSVPAADKIQYFVHLNFNSTLQLINGISSDVQTLLEYFNGTAIVVFSKIPLVLPALVFSNNLSLHLKDLELLSLAYPY